MLFHNSLVYQGTPQFMPLDVGSGNIWQCASTTNQWGGGSVMTNSLPEGGGYVPLALKPARHLEKHLKHLSPAVNVQASKSLILQSQRWCYTPFHDIESIFWLWLWIPSGNKVTASTYAVNSDDRRTQLIKYFTTHSLFERFSLYLAFHVEDEWVARITPLILEAFTFIGYKDGAEKNELYLFTSSLGQVVEKHIRKLLKVIHDYHRKNLTERLHWEDMVVEAISREGRWKSASNFPEMDDLLNETDSVMKSFQWELEEYAPTSLPCERVSLHPMASKRKQAQTQEAQ